MHLPEFIRFCEESFVPDEHSKFCKRSQLPPIFNGANFKATSADATLEESNLDDALTRFEWLNVVVRLAMAKYGRGGKVVRIAEAIDAFCREHIYTRRDGAVVPVSLPPEALFDPNEFRRSRLYAREVDDVIRNNMTFLAALYMHYAWDAKYNEFHALQVTALGATPAGMRRVAMTGWVAMLTDLGILDGTHPAVEGIFTLHMARMAFVFGRAQSYDEVEDFAARYGLSWVDFVDALGHVADCLSWPTEVALKKAGFGSMAEYEQAVQRDRGNMLPRRPSVGLLTPPTQPLAAKYAALVDALKAVALPELFRCTAPQLYQRLPGYFDDPRLLEVPLEEEARRLRVDEGRSPPRAARLVARVPAWAGRSLPPPDWMRRDQRRRRAGRTGSRGRSTRGRRAAGRAAAGTARRGRGRRAARSTIQRWRPRRRGLAEGRTTAPAARAGRPPRRSPPRRGWRTRRPRLPSPPRRLAKAGWRPARRRTRRPSDDRECR